MRYLMLSVARGVGVGLAIGLVIIASVWVATLSPTIELGESEAQVSAYVFPHSRTNLLLIEYPADSGAIAPIGCHYHFVDEDVIRLTCGLQEGWNTYTLAGKMRYISAYAAVGSYSYRTDK